MKTATTALTGKVTQTPWTLFSHLVKGVLTISLGIAAYGGAEEIAALEPASHLIGLAVSVLAAKYFYLSNHVTHATGSPVDLSKSDPVRSDEEALYPLIYDPAYNFESINIHYDDSVDGDRLIDKELP